MSYTRVNWKNTPNISTPLSAENLNKMDVGIKQNADDIDVLKQKTYDSELNTISTNAPQTQAVKKAIDSIRIETDDSLTIEGAAADAQATGDAIDSVRISKMTIFDGGYQDDAGYVHLTLNGDDIDGFEPFKTGTGSGGGGSGNNAVLTVQNTTGWLSKTIAVGADCELSLTWSSLEDEIPTGQGTLRITVNGLIKSVQDVQQGAVTVDASRFLTSSTNIVRLTISDIYGNTRSISFTITVVDVSINSSFDAYVPYNSAINFTYTPVGKVSKTVYFILDGTQIGTATVSTSSQQSFTIPMQEHGHHTFRVYFTCEIDGNLVTSNELYYDIMFVEDGNTTPIIASNFRQSEIEQFSNAVIEYTVYDPESLTTEVTLTANGNVVSTQTVDRTKQTWSYKCSTAGSLILSIQAGNTVRPFNITVNELDIDVDPVTNDLALYLSSYGRSNNEQNPAQWVYGNISATFTNFNFSSDGWQLDSDNNTVLRVSGDARLTIPYQIFAQDFRTSGKTIELEFATRNVKDYDATILSCMSGGRGVQITAQKASIASEQSAISTQYKEDEHVRISFVVQKRSENRLLFIYINGIMSGVVQYPDNDDFSQRTPVGISVGSNDCTIDLYCIRVYNNDLTRHQVLNNWIADTQNAEVMLERYIHNNVYDEYGDIVISKLPTDLPYMILTADELPQYKGDKKTISVTYVDPVNPLRSFTAENVQADVQGTSSQFYARKNYKLKYRNGMTMQNGTQVDGIAIRTGDIATNVFTMKADVASSEGANNVELVRLYNDACPYKTPAQIAGAVTYKDGDKTVTRYPIRQGIDGFPIVIFWNNGTTTSFLGKYNFNNDKGTPEVFGFSGNDESWETLNNTSNRVLWKSADYDSMIEDEEGNPVPAWQSDFESRFPEDYFTPTQLREFSEWAMATDQTQATGNALPSYVTYDGVTYTNDTAEYRLAKFKAEAWDYMEKDSTIFYYLFTELFLMVDSRAKNSFPSFIGSTI